MPWIHLGDMSMVLEELSGYKRKLWLQKKQRQRVSWEDRTSHTCKGTQTQNNTRRTSNRAGPHLLLESGEMRHLQLSVGMHARALEATSSH